ncbi:MAG TPA: hypothetical protein VF815_31935 [Myxococcaceae bacterium]|jgi:hypothetical protein
MNARKVGALLLALVMTACASAPRQVPGGVDSYERELEAARYELRVLTAGSGDDEPVEVEKEDFQRVMRVLAPGIHPSDRPDETARWLMEGGLQTHVLAEVRRGQVVRLTPVDESSPLAAETAAQMTLSYLALCQRLYGGGDCLGFLKDGPTLKREDLRMLALALSLRGVLKETWASLQEMVSPQALVAMVVWTAGVYLTMWLLPEPTTKLLAAGMTLALLAWLPAATLWELMDGWARLMHEVDRATSFAQVQAASERFSQVMGENTARVLVLVVTAALTGSAAKLSQQLPKLPGFSRAAARAEAQGTSLAEAASVEEVAAAGEGTFTLMVRGPGTRAAAASETRAGATIIIRHHGGNRLVSFLGRRFNVPANRSLKEIPTRDPMGDELEAAAQRIAKEWGPDDLQAEAVDAIRQATEQGRYWLARLLERQARGRFVEARLRQQFAQLKWNSRGVDAIDPTTGYRYEVLSGTDSNMALHGRRLAEEFFRLITF